MRALRIMILGALAILGVWGARAQAGDGAWSIGVRVGVPAYPRPYCAYPRPYCAYPPYYYYRPYPVFWEPPPVFVRPVQVVQPVYQVPPSPPPVFQAPPPAPLPTQVALYEDPSPEVERNMQMLVDPNENVRANAVLRLGRLKAVRAIDPLAATLAGDASPSVRETAARALGLIGSAKAMPALQRAAQLDADRDVRNSARFAIEIVQSNRGN